VAQVLVERTGAPSVPGVMIAAVAIAVLPVFVLMHETAPRQVGRFALGNKRN
jgi:MHS family proline/betaine transporter-like MFS transporter